MTVKATLVRTCDRCSRVFEDIPLKPGGTIPLVRQKGLIVLEVTGDGTESKTREHTAFEDLCPKCLESVVAILARLSLGPAKTSKAPKAPKDPDAPKQVRKPRKSKEAAEPQADGSADPVPVYSEEDLAEAPTSEVSVEPTDPNPLAAAPIKEGLVKDPETGELYDPETGEVVTGQPVVDELPF
jgi:hypothetical protein